MVGRKLTRKRKPVRASSVQYPARLKEGEDAQEDVTATKGEPAQHMNQSIFSMIAAAGSKVDFNARLDEEEESSDSDDDDPHSAFQGDVKEQSNHSRPQTQLDGQHEDNLPREKPRRPLGESAEHRGLRSLPKLDLRTIEEKSYMSQSLRLPSSEVLNQHPGSIDITPRDAPVMSRMLESHAELIPSTPPLEIGNTGAQDTHVTIDKDAPINLATRLMGIFGFKRPEEVLSGIQN